jgi:hypothetical protein
VNKRKDHDFGSGVSSGSGDFSGSVFLPGDGIISGGMDGVSGVFTGGSGGTGTGLSGGIPGISF